MNLSQLRAEFERMGAEDPMWAVLTDPDKRGGKWDPDEFFATGVKDVHDVLGFIERAGVQLARGRALDFGCGVGRLSQALATHFDQVVGVDIAVSMVEAARRLDGSRGRCTFVVNTKDDLAQLTTESFDFVYTHITLQHMEPRYSLRYMDEFTRLLRPGGVAVFQVPVPNARPRLTDAVKQHAPALVRMVRRLGRPGEPLIEMYAVPESDVERVLGSGGLSIFAKVEDPNTARGAHSVVFYAKKSGMCTVERQ